LINEISQLLATIWKISLLACPWK